MIAMWHKFNYSHEGVDKEVMSHMVYIGKNSQFTAMSDTVGLPLAIAAKLLLNGKKKIGESSFLLKRRYTNLFLLNWNSSE